MLRDQWRGDEAEGESELTGYRLPTEAEMEYSTRSGAFSARFFGETDELMPKYAWCVKNSQGKTLAEFPVGSLKPNDLGFVNVQGNVFSWCQESYRKYPSGEKVSDDKEDESVVISAHVPVCCEAARSCILRCSCTPPSVMPDGAGYLRHRRRFSPGEDHAVIK